MAPGEVRPIACKKECYICDACEWGSITGMECGKLSCLAFLFPIYFCLFVPTAFSFPQLFSGVWFFSFLLSFLSNSLGELLGKSVQFMLVIIAEEQELIALIITWGSYGEI